jgi:uncharacterized C2H2 Zn-finger protein
MHCGVLEPRSSAGGWRSDRCVIADEECNDERMHSCHADVVDVLQFAKREYPSMKRHFPETNGDETITCPACQALNKTHAEFCRKCGYSFGFATLDPVLTIRSQGSFLKRSIERPSKMALAVIWIIHLPLLMLCIFLAIYFILNRTEFGSFVFFWVFIGCAYIAFAILYRITRNYSRHRKKIEE